jgi:hypothetical protein
MDTRGIEFVRILWGNFKDIKPTPLYNETVYVWGLDNYNKLIDLGYKCVLMSNENTIHNNENTKFLHKLIGLKEASLNHNKFIFMDWDVELEKELDDEFFKEFDNKEFLMPTYSYPNEYLSLTDKLIDIGAKNWTNQQIIEMEKYGWREDDNIVLPNAGFIYCTNPSIPNRLLEIAIENELTTLIEEFAMYIYSQTDFISYILKYEPSVIFGRPSDTIFTIGDIKRNTELTLHNKIKSLTRKNVYFTHQ